MKTPTKTKAAALCAAAVALLAGCNGSSTSFNPFSPSRGTLRIINGSPDVGTVDVAIGVANHPNFTALPYAGNSQDPSSNANAGISQYVPFNAPQQNIYVYQAGTSNQIAFPQSSVTITPNGRTTVVLTGSVAQHNLRFATFSEHLFKTVQGSASVSFHHASREFVTKTFTVGDQAATSSSACAASFATIPPAAIFSASPPTFQEGLPASVASAGIQFCSSGAGTTLGLLPSQVDGGNAANVMPYDGPTAVNGDQNLSIYIIDGPLGSGKPLMVGVFDPDN